MFGIVVPVRVNCTIETDFDDGPLNADTKAMTVAVSCEAIAIRDEE